MRGVPLCELMAIGTLSSQSVENPAMEWEANLINGLRQYGTVPTRVTQAVTHTDSYMCDSLHS